MTTPTRLDCGQLWPSLAKVAMLLAFGPLDFA